MKRDALLAALHLNYDYVLVRIGEIEVVYRALLFVCSAVAVEDSHFPARQLWLRRHSLACRDGRIPFLLPFLHTLLIVRTLVGRDEFLQYAVLWIGIVKLTLPVEERGVFGGKLQGGVLKAPVFACHRPHKSLAEGIPHALIRCLASVEYHYLSSQCEVFLYARYGILRLDDLPEGGRIVVVKQCGFEHFLKRSVVYVAQCVVEHIGLLEVKPREGT